MKQQSLNLILILDNIRSTHNVGAITRTADGLGVSEVITYQTTPHLKQANDTRLPHVIDRASRQIAKTSLGAEQTLGRHIENIQELKETLKGFEIIAIEQTENSEDISNFVVKTNSIALILGNEVNGVSSELLSLATTHLHIPMRGVKNSLNVSAAASIAMFYFQTRALK